MDYSDYLREQAAKYRQLAETAEDPSVKREILELAAVCERWQMKLTTAGQADSRNNGLNKE
jgi:hypothetical protein